MINNEIDSLFLGYIDDDKYGKLAHYMDSDNSSIYYKEIERDGFVFHEELNDIEKEEFISRVYGNLLDEGV